jgi:hypothetical protein
METADACPFLEANAMSITRRDALTAVVGCTLTATAAGADEKPTAKEPPRPDPVYSALPVALRKIAEETFPNHRCIRLVTRDAKQPTVYRITVFDPASVTTHHQRDDGDRVSSPVLYHLELDATGKVLEETLHPLNPARMPAAVMAAYEKWNPKGVKGVEHWWLTEVQRGKDRIIQAYIIVNPVKAYRAWFKEDGTVIKANPVVIP